MAEKKGSRTQLMVAIEVGEGALERLEAVLGNAPIASVIVTPTAGHALAAGDVLGLVAAGQKAGVAVLIAGDARLARTVKADGVHLEYAEKIREPFEEARAMAGGRAIVGADAGRTRHTAMELGELGADYVAFGVPAFVKDRDTAFERQIDLIEWWAEIFEIQCVAANVESAEQARALTEAGADFVCFEVKAGTTAGDAGETARAFAAAVSGEDAGSEH